MSQQEQAQRLRETWSSPRWNGITRKYSPEEVIKLRPTIDLKFSFAERGSQKLWELFSSQAYVKTMGTLNGSQAVQNVRAGLQALYVSGWQVAADANAAQHTYPDQSLYPSHSAPMLVKRLNNALMRADQIQRNEGGDNLDWYVPIMADAEAGFGGPLHSFELMRGMIEAGASAVHFEDQLAAEKKCGHLGGKVLIPTSQFVTNLTAARLASDVCGVPTVIVARTDALGANLLTSDIDPYDHSFMTGERTPEGYHRLKPGLDSAIARALAYAPYADMLWFETAHPDIGEVREFAKEIHQKFPGKLLAYNCSPSFNWEKNLSAKEIASFQEDLAEHGYKFQFITLAGWHSINYHAYDLAQDYREHGMSAYVRLQSKEFAKESEGYTATKHQREVGTGYFDSILMAATGGAASTAALAGSTEAEQF